MLERKAWSSLTREVTHTAFISSQDRAPDGAWYVPFCTGVALLEGGQLLVISHIGSEPDADSLEHFERSSHGRERLITDGIYECAGVSIHIDPIVKILIHAYGPQSLKYLLAAFSNLIEHSSR